MEPVFNAQLTLQLVLQKLLDFSVQWDSIIIPKLHAPNVLPKLPLVLDQIISKPVSLDITLPQLVVKMFHVHYVMLPLTSSPV